MGREILQSKREKWPKNSQITPALARIREEETIDAISTKDIIGKMGDIAIMCLSGLDQISKVASSGLNLTREISQPPRSNAGVALSAEKAEFQRSRGKSRMLHRSEISRNGFVGVNLTPPTANSHSVRKYIQSILKRSTSNLEKGGSSKKG